MLEYGNLYSANKLKGDSGDTLPVLGFKVNAAAAITRLIYSTDYALLGGSLAMHALLPVVDLKVSVAGTSQHKTGLGDITFGPAIAYHHSPNLRSVPGLDLVAPVGRFDKNDLANIGRNAMSYIDPHGFNGDFKVTLSLNRKNSDTDYKSGNELWLDYAARWAFADSWTAGVGGYWTQQLSSDEAAGNTLDHSKARGFAIGPSLKYDDGKGRFVTAKLRREIGSHNRAEVQDSG